jgi:hypothetical protein
LSGVAGWLLSGVAGWLLSGVAGWLLSGVAGWLLSGVAGWLSPAGVAAREVAPAPDCVSEDVFGVDFCCPGAADPSVELPCAASAGVADVVVAADPGPAA